jgi:hypothetical protein
MGFLDMLREHLHAEVPDSQCPFTAHPPTVHTTGADLASSICRFRKDLARLQTRLLLGAAIGVAIRAATAAATVVVTGGPMSTGPHRDGRHVVDPAQWAGREASL